MAFELWDFVDLRGKNNFKEWTATLQVKQLARLNERLDKLMQYGDALFPQMLSATPVPGILKLKIKGNVQLRPLLCKGPASVASEYTLLLGAKEVGDRWQPTNAPEMADLRRNQVRVDPKTRRTKHERVVR